MPHPMLLRQPLQEGEVNPRKIWVPQGIPDAPY